MSHLFGICNLAVVPLRAEPSDRSEMVSQLLFGDRFEITEQNDKWALVRTAYDDYSGWVDRKQFAEMSLDDFVTAHDLEQVSGLSWSATVEKTPDGHAFNLVPGSSLSFNESGQLLINGNNYTYQGPVIEPGRQDFAKGVEQAARFYLNAPYLWGGRSPLGIDCSGFCQVVFKLFGIKLKRDASLQALQGVTVDFLPEAITGDLAFFDNEEGRIVHVGIMLGNAQIIHASGCVKIETIDDQGIYSSELKRHTHRLRIIKRFTAPAQ